MESEIRVRVVFPQFQHRDGRRDIFVGWYFGDFESDESDTTIRIGVYDDLGEAYIVSLGDPINENPFAGHPTHFVGGVPQFHLPFGFDYIGKVDRITGCQTHIKNKITKAIKNDHQIVIHGGDRDHFWTGPKELISSIRFLTWSLSPTGQAFTADLQDSGEGTIAPIFLRDFVLYSSTKKRILKQLKELVHQDVKPNKLLN